LSVIVYDKKERLRRAAAILGLFWLLSLMSLPIVVAHWALVPGFFLAGLISGYRRYNTSSVNEGVSGRCPACRKEVTIHLEANEKLPKWTYCAECGSPIELSE